MKLAPPPPQTAFIKELQSRYDQNGPGLLLSQSDIDLWTELVGSMRHEAYNVLARHLAVGFHEGRLSFWFCDAVANATVGFVYDDCLAKGENLPSLFYGVYLAFDGGEVGRPGVDPIEANTRPMIARIVRGLVNDAD